MAFGIGKKSVEVSVTKAVNEGMTAQKKLMEEVLHQYLQPYIEEIECLKKVIQSQEGTLITIYDEVISTRKAVKRVRKDIREGNGSIKNPLLKKIRDKEFFFDYIKRKLNHNNGKVHVALTYVYEELVSMGHPLYQKLEEAKEIRSRKPHGEKGKMPRLYDIVATEGLSDIAMSLSQKAVTYARKSKTA